MRSSKILRIVVLGAGLMLSTVPRSAAADGDAPRVREEQRDGDAARPRDGDRPAPAAADVQPTGSGTFVRVERGAMLLSDDANDRDVRVAIKDGTKVNIDGRPATLRELRPGTAVTVTQQDGATVVEAKRPRWLKLVTPPPRGEGERPNADRPREAPAGADPNDPYLTIEQRMRLRRQQDVNRPRAEGERPPEVRPQKADPNDPNLTLEERMKLRREREVRDQPAVQGEKQ
jgi:hypothetical protein